MKNLIKLVRITVFAAVTVLFLAGCGEKGGTLMIENKTGRSIDGYAISGYYTEQQLSSDEYHDVLIKGVKSINDGEMGTWTFSSNGNVTWCFRAGNVFKYGEIVKLEKGVDETVTARL